MSEAPLLSNPAKKQDDIVYDKERSWVVKIRIKNDPLGRLRYYRSKLKGYKDLFKTYNKDGKILREEDIYNRFMEKKVKKGESAQKKSHPLYCT